MRVEVVDAGGDSPRRCELVLVDGATVAAALAAAAVVVPDGGAVGVHGRPRQPEDALAEGDRVEVYGPLRADPKQARRLRARRLRLS